MEEASVPAIGKTPPQQLPAGGNPVGRGNAAPVGGRSPNNMAPGKALNVPKLPTSQFAGTSGVDGPPQIDIQPVKQPDTYVTVEFILEHWARVLLEIAERQEDPVWSQQHQQLAEQWRNGAQMLLEHAVNTAQAQGDAELKQQQLNQNHEVHMQTLSQNDQKHTQDMRHTDDQHKQQLRQKDTEHRFGLQQQSQQAKAQQQVGQQKLQMGQQKMQTQKQLDRKKVVQAGRSAASRPTPRKPAQ